SLPKGAGTILVVDDEEDLREIAVLYLEILGYQTLTAENGDKALEVLNDGHDIDLLFSDVVMPGEMDGYQLAVTAHERYPELKVLLTSGFTKKRSKLHSAGDKYLVDLNDMILDKPYNLAELAIALQNTFNEQG
ncbi:MAG: response regulator, partial [Sneathiella sp.]